MKTALMSVGVFVGSLVFMGLIMAAGLWILNNETFLRFSAWVEAGYLAFVVLAGLAIFIMVAIDRMVRLVKRFGRFVSRPS